MSDDEEFPIYSLKNALAVVLHNIATPEGEDKFLSTHPGRGLSVLEMGMSRVHQHPLAGRHSEAAPALEEAVKALYGRAEQLCDSPIERNLLAALVTGCWAFNPAVIPTVLNVKGDQRVPKNDVTIVPQLTIGRYRLDFGIVIAKGGQKHIIGIECDGADFHQDKVKDFDRDEYLAAFGVPVLRFQGSTLHRAPISMADAIIDAITVWRDE